MDRGHGSGHESRVSGNGGSGVSRLIGGEETAARCHSLHDIPMEYALMRHVLAHTAQSAQYQPSRNLTHSGFFAFFSNLASSFANSFNAIISS